MIDRFRLGEDPEALRYEYAMAASDDGPTLKSPLDHVVGRYLMGAKNRARRLKVGFDLTHEWLASRITGNCEATGLPFDLSCKKGPFTPSLDRTIPGGDYTQSNVRVVCRAYNQAKLNWGHDDVVRMALALIHRESEQADKPR